MWLLIGTMVVLNSNILYGKLVGDHVCLMEESYPVNVTEHRTRNATIRNYKWCMNVPPRCSFYTVKTINDTRIVTKTFTRTVERCCDGFMEENDTCVSRCRDACKHGVCNNGTCLCSAGFNGVGCDVACNNGTWGTNCSRKCECEGENCDPVTGECKSVSSTTTNNYFLGTETHTATTVSLPAKTDKSTAVLTTTTSTPALSTTTSETPRTTHSRELSTVKFSSVDIDSYTTPVTVKTGLHLTTTTHRASTTLESTAGYSTSNIVSSTTSKLNKEYFIPVEVKYEEYDKPIQKKDEENYAEEKNYITLEDRRLINEQISADTQYLINSFSVVGVVISVVVVFLIIFLGWKSWKRKEAMKKKDERKDVIVCTTSIFHTPLPDPPPAIENPSYLSTTSDCKICDNETIMLKTRPVYTQRASQLNEVRDYVYDHPPSTGSYRAGSTVDRSEIGSETEPVYDEIPQRNGSINCSTKELENMSLYVNTSARTKF